VTFRMHEWELLESPDTYLRAGEAIHINCGFVRQKKWVCSSTCTPLMDHFKRDGEEKAYFENRSRPVDGHSGSMCISHEANALIVDASQSTPSLFFASMTSRVRLACGLSVLLICTRMTYSGFPKLCVGSAPQPKTTQCKATSLSLITPLAPLVSHSQFSIYRARFSPCKKYRTVYALVTRLLPNYKGV
jgi:hypothetical protein